MWKTSSVVAFGIALVFATAGCEGENAFVGGPLSVGEDELFVEQFDIVGFWTGQEEITRTGDVATSTDDGEGFSFPIAIRFEEDGEFVLRSFNYPLPGGGTEDRVCRGVFDRDGRELILFPNDVCPPLPLIDFTIGRTLPDGLVLTAETDGGAGSGAASVSVHITIERDD